MTSSRRIARIAALTVPVMVFATLSGCSGGSGGSTIPLSQRVIIQETEASLEAYWAGAIDDFSTAEFARPEDVIIYTEDNTPVGSDCIEHGSSIWRNNSFYCPSDEVMYLDADYFTYLGRDFTNPAIAGVIIQAHEFGHHLQYLDGATYDLSIGQELQADCYAGVYLAALTNGDATLSGLGTWSAFEAIQTIRDIAVDTPTNWTEVGAHGTPLERSQAVATGYLTGDAQFCAGYETTGPILPLTIGGYTFLPPADSTITELTNGYRITTSSEPSITLDVSAREGLPTGAVDGLVQTLPIYLGTGYSFLGSVEQFAQVGALDASSFRYGLPVTGGSLYGALVLATRGDGTGILIDAYSSGVMPADGDPAWVLIGNAAFSSLWGVAD